MPENTSKRGKVQGWSSKTTGRLRRWLFSVDGASLPDRGFGLTLTVRDRVPTPDAWAKCRRRFIERLRYDGLDLLQWLTEFQRRGVPHMHGMAFFKEDAEASAECIVKHWLGAAKEFGPAARSQDVQQLWGLAGWLKYQTKHAARGVRHVQRVAVPQEWQDGTGRMWGVVGDWPTREEAFEIDLVTFHRARRLMRAWLIAEAREKGERYRAVSLRRLLKDSNRARSSVRGMGEFVPEAVTHELLLAASYGELLDTSTKSASTPINTGFLKHGVSEQSGENL